MLTSNLRNISFHSSRALIALPVALALSACVVGTKVGDLPEETASAADTMDTTGTAGGSTGTTGGGSTEGKDSSTDGKDSSGGPQTDTSDSTGLPLPITTDGPAECEGLDEAACGATPGCWVLHGEAYAFEGCPALPQYLGCKVDTGCSEDEISVCRDGTDEVYWRPDGCIPPGFSQCETPLARCGSCEALDEVTCQDDGDLCAPLYGAPHVLQDGEMCVDFEKGVFLACAPSEPCEPWVPTVCPIGDPEPRFDVTSGCIPFGFEVCEGATQGCK